MVKRIVLLLIAGCMILSLISCAPITFDDGRGSCTYKGHTYVGYVESTDSSWHLTPTTDQIEAIFLTYGKVYMPSVVYATKEDVPNFILMNRNLIGQEDFSNRYDAIAFIREDIELASIYEATYSSVVAEYAEWVADDEKYFSDIPQNITFADLVNMDKIEDVPENGEYYCDLLFRHSDYTYLQGKFNVIMADGEFYLLGLTNGFAGTCCYKTLIQPGR